MAVPSSFRSPIGEFSRSFESESPALAADVEATAFVRSQLDLRVYGVAGPYVRWNSYLVLESDVRTVDAPWWQLYGGGEVGVGVEGRFLGRSMADYHLPAVVEYRDLIGQAEYPFLNLPPVASADTDQEVSIGETVVLDGSGSEDPEAMGLRYAWRQTDGPAVGLSDASTSQPSFMRKMPGPMSSNWWWTTASMKVNRMP